MVVATFVGFIVVGESVDPKSQCIIKFYWNESNYQICLKQICKNYYLFPVPSVEVSFVDWKVDPSVVPIWNQFIKYNIIC